ncbi:MAG: DNA-binding LytR/AlgR family response regulator [Neolewinella sp.]|jgi:DNA-binding LytR/AlgR family response regulator
MGYQVSGDAMTAEEALIILEQGTTDLEVVSGDKKYMLRSPLGEFVQQLPPEHFFQTHRSYIVNLALVDKIGGNFVGIGTHEVPLSRNVRQEVMTRLSMYG